MPTKSSAEPSAIAPWPLRVRLWMLLWNFFPLLHVLAIPWATMAVPAAWVLPAIPLLVFLPPPLLCRLTLWLRPVTGGSYRTGQPQFLTWWATAQMQMLFCRLPFLEEALRLVPGLYSAWLRLWGARIGRLVFWSPGVRLLDRSFLRVGDEVILGAGTRLSAHLIVKEGAIPLLHLAEICLGSGSLIGGYSLLSAGARVGENETLPACVLLPPFAVWREGKRVKIAVS